MVDYIDSDETCKLSENIIIVTKKPKTYVLGCVLAIISSFIIIGFLIVWIEDIYHKWKYKN